LAESLTIGNISGSESFARNIAVDICNFGGFEFRFTEVKDLS